MNYVCGFPFNASKTEVSLIMKNRPDFLKNKLNGIGGKIENFDTSAINAMVREFKEESGCDTVAEEWEPLGNLWFNDHSYCGNQCVNFYKIVLDDESYNTIRTMEDEIIASYPINEVFSLPMDPHAQIFLLCALRGDISSVDIFLK